jgi:hypothetical protein
VQRRSRYGSRRCFLCASTGCVSLSYLQTSGKWTGCGLARTVAVKLTAASCGELDCFLAPILTHCEHLNGGRLWAGIPSLPCVAELIKGQGCRDNHLSWWIRQRMNREIGIEADQGSIESNSRGHLLAAAGIKVVFGCGYGRVESWTAPLDQIRQGRRRSGSIRRLAHFLDTGGPVGELLAVPAPWQHKNGRPVGSG